MKRSEIKVGETYGVRLSHRERSGVVPATVVALDEPYPHKAGKWGQETQTAKDGGIRVRFAEPTRLGFYDFMFAKNTNDGAGEIVEEYVFGDKRNGGSAGKCFVGVWAELENQRKTVARVQRERKETFKKEADEFAPVLAAYVKRLKKIGLPVDAYSDGSGLHGPVSVELYSTGYENGNRPCGFGYRASLPVEIFNQLVEIAERHGEKIKVSR